MRRVIGDEVSMRRDMLRILFAEHDRIANDLADVREALNEELKAYSYAQGLKVPMRPEQARREVGMEVR